MQSQLGVFISFIYVKNQVPIEKVSSATKFIDLFCRLGHIYLLRLV